jgi:hypothetical protein
LQCLSLGNNRIDSLEQVVRLRQIRSLRMLTLANNPIESNAEYRMTVLAYVDSLHYLDYAMIDKAEKIAAKEQYHDELLDVEEKESVANEQVTRDKSVELYLVQLDHACILFAYTVFDDMFYEDNEIKRLLCLPGIKVRVFPLSFSCASSCIPVAPSFSLTRLPFGLGVLCCGAGAHRDVPRVVQSLVRGVHWQVAGTLRQEAKRGRRVRPRHPATAVEGRRGKHPGDVLLCAGHTTLCARALSFVDQCLSRPVCCRHVSPCSSSTRTTCRKKRWWTS